MSLEIHSFLKNRQTLVVGILNITPDSFSGDGFYTPQCNIHTIMMKARHMIRCGCHVIEIGAESSKPGAEFLSLDTEQKRIFPVIDAISYAKIPFSIETRKAAVARYALAKGALMVNDVSALSDDSEMINLVTDYQCHTVIMHGGHQQAGTDYKINNVDLMNQIITFFQERTHQVIEQGLAQDKILIDPGIGFGKSPVDNIHVMQSLSQLCCLNYPLFLGVSRKSMIGNICNAPVDQRLGGSLSAMLWGVMQGASVVRVHDVFETVQALKILETFAMPKNPVIPLEKF